MTLPWSSERCLIIGEVAQAHDGSLGLAHAFIDAIAAAGADAVKFQTHIAAAESTPAEPWRVKFSRQDASRYDYWRRMEFSEAQWAGLKKHANEKGLLFLSSPFSAEAVDLLSRIGVTAWKIASGEVATPDVFDRIAATHLPVMISTGMSGWSEIDDCVARVRAERLPFALLQCTTAYPCPPERVGLNLLDEFRHRYDCSVGLSDHSGTIYAGLAAAALRAEVLEVHVTLSREMYGPDVPASLTTGELAQLVEGVRWIETMRSHPVDKDQAHQSVQSLRQMFTKSAVTRRELKRGALLVREDLAAKKPGSGIPAAAIPQLVGRRVKRDLPADHLLHEDDFEN